MTSVVGGSYNESSSINSSNSISQYAKWTPNITDAGDYEVYVWKHSYSTTSTTAAKYTVYYNGGSQTYTVNQQSPSDQWEKICTKSFAAGTGGYVKLTADGGIGTAVRADAVKFVKTSSGTPTPSPTPTPIPTLLAQWELNETSGSTTDDSIGSNDGTVTGASWETEDGYNCLEFDGSGDYVITSSSVLNPSSTDFTACAWIKIDNTSAGASKTLTNEADGHIDDVRIYDEELTGTQISSIYNGGHAN